MLDKDTILVRLSEQRPVTFADDGGAGNPPERPVSTGGDGEDNFDWESLKKVDLDFAGGCIIDLSTGTIVQSFGQIDAEPDAWLALYNQSVAVTSSLGHNHVAQIVCRTPQGHCIVASHGFTVLCASTRSASPPLDLMRRILVLV